jgi:hypothetical protein
VPSWPAVLTFILPTSQVCLSDILEKHRVVDGVHEVAGKVYDDLYNNINFTVFSLVWMAKA